jgi:DNA-binding CsgD family transcriptional regulator
MTAWPFVAWCPGGEVCLANQEFADLGGESVGALIGRPLAEVAERYGVDGPHSAGALSFLRNAGVETIRVRRELRPHGHATSPVRVWARAVEIGDETWGVAFALPVPEVAAHGDGGEAVGYILDRIVLGVVDESWTVLAISGGTEEALSVGPDQIVGTRLFEWIQGDGLAADDPLLLEEARPVLLTGSSGASNHAAILWAPAVSGSLERTFALQPTLPTTRERANELEMRLSRIAAEVQAAGFAAASAMPRRDRVSQLATLTDRQWAVLSRLLDGMTPGQIAADLYVSPSTVRNHLSAIFGKFGVHSQVQLLRLLAA